MLNRLLAFLPAALVVAYGLWVGPAYDRFVLPAFDGHAYAVMAENPRFFTLAPWGYRIVEPWIVHLLPASSAAVGFYWLNLGFLAAAMIATSRWLRRLGFSAPAAALASSAFAMSPPMRILLDYQVLVDPLALLLLVLILEELLRPDLLVLTALLAVAGLTKEAGLLWIILLPLHLVRRVQPWRGVLDSAAVAAPALGLAILLRLTWGSPDPPPYSFPVLDVTLGRALASGWALVSAALLSGLVFPALVGVFREPSVALRGQAAILWSFTFGLVLANPYLYSVADLPRLSLLAWPALLPLALSGLGFRRTPVPPPPPRPERLRTAAAALSLLLCLGAVAATDPYRRAPFARPHDPIVLAGRVRETLKTAAALEAGETFLFDARSGRFAAPVTESFNLTEARRHRWFLLDGFGPGAVFGSGSPAFQGEAQLLLPLFIPRAVTLSMELDGPRDAQVTIGVAGRNIAALRAGERATFSIPGHRLHRGDNVLRLSGPKDASLRLVRFEARLERPGDPRR